MIREFYKLLSSNPVEIRSQTKDDKWISEYVTDEDSFVDAVESKNGHHKGVFCSLQQLKPDRIKRWENGDHRPISASDVERYTTIVFDCDPVRNGPATPEQTQLALDTAKAIGGFLAAWGEPTYAISGNGAYCIFKCNLPKEDKHLIHGCLLAADSLFSTNAVKVDTTLASESQVIRIPGTKNLKVPDESREAKLLKVESSGRISDLPAVPIMQTLS